MDKELTPQEFKVKKQAQEKEAFAILDYQTKKDMSDEALFLDLLDKVSLHTASSVANVILAQAQKPEATAVMSIAEWEKRNIFVKKDKNDYYPKGIYQFAKDGFYTDDNGEVHDKYKVVKGYDAEQTNDPEYARSIINAAKPVKVFFNSSDAEVTRNVALCNSSPIKCLPYDENKLIDPAEYISEGARYIPQTKTVIIRKAGRETWFQNVAFEIAHGVLHKLKGSEYSRDKCSAEAGITAYMLCRMAGVSTQAFHMNDFWALQTRYTPEQFRRVIESCYNIAHDLAFRLNNKLRDKNKAAQPPARQDVAL